MAGVGRPRKIYGEVKETPKGYRWKFYYQGKTADGKKHMLINADGVCFLAPEDKFQEQIKLGYVYGCTFNGRGYDINITAPTGVNCPCGHSTHAVDCVEIAMDVKTGRQTKISGRVYFDFRSAMDGVYMYNLLPFRAVAAKKLGCSSEDIRLATVDGFKPSNKVLSANNITMEQLGLRCPHCRNLQYARVSPPKRFGGMY